MHTLLTVPGRHAESLGFARQTLSDGNDIHVGSLPCELTPAPPDFEALWELCPKERSLIRMGPRLLRIPRFQQALERAYAFSGQVSLADPAPDIIRPFWKWTQESIDARLNGLLVNWYDGLQRHYIGPHHDDIRQLVTHSPIVTISLGAERVFRLTRAEKRNGRRVTVASHDIPVSNGSVVVMPWQTNLAWKHSVPHFARHVGRRISITLRVFR